MAGNSSIKLPVPLLILNMVQSSHQQNVSCSPPQQSNTTNNQDYLLYESGLQYPLLTMCSTDCPFIGATVRAPVCAKITRNKFYLIEEGVLSRLNKTDMAEVNCSVSGTALPRDIFLDKSQWYNFTMEFYLGMEYLGNNVDAPCTTVGYLLVA